jgi:ABC-type microcin C transport system permease subunit YejB
MLVLSYILGRLAQMVPVVLGMVLIAFLTIQLVPATRCGSCCTAARPKR